MVGIIKTDLPTDIYYTDEYLKLYEQNGDGKLTRFKYSSGNYYAEYLFLLNSINAIGYDLDEEYYDIQGAYGYNGVLSNTNDLEFISKFYLEFYNYCKSNNIVAEFTRFHPVLSNQMFSKEHMSVIYDRPTVGIDLTKTYESIWNETYSSKNRNMIRKANNIKYTIEIINNPSKEQIDNFIEIYYYAMTVAGANQYYFFNKKYFYNLFEMLKKNTLLFRVLNVDNLVVCAAIFFHYNKYFHYHLSGRTKLADNTANNYIIDEAVKKAISLGAEYFHLGGGRTASLDDSLFKFKSNFSKSVLSFYIGKKIHNVKIYNEVIKQWEEKNPNIISKYANHILKYRYQNE